jgi:hypothetical protein
MATARPAWWLELVLVAFLYALYELARHLRTDDVATAMSNGRAILSWEQAWHLDPERLLNQDLSQLTLVAVLAAYFYATLHYVVTPVVLVWMYRSHPEHYRMARTTLAASTLTGLLGYYFLPTAPPRLLSGAGFDDLLEDVHEWGWWSGDGSVPRGLGGLSNQFAAIPSLHVGWALWCGVLIAMYARRRIVRWVGALYPVMTSIVVVATGNHYLVDTVAGAATMGVGAVIAWVLARPVAAPGSDADRRIVAQHSSTGGDRSIAQPDPYVGS